MNTTSRLALASATHTTAKAVVFGVLASMALVIGIAHAQGQRELRASIVTLDPVVISVKREQLPTVYITGRRDASVDGSQVASIQ
ncbi:hypothetical protein CDN99_13230 [Roseateles aquatilis]|uniref:Uncharacterized protein n=1 Tax=Roseateles aquatilis TaxID=431061 RepID=A0A246IVZ2_9BURK|nr:hypothetical protein [Roseateles aquatilis]OWQ84370.1 hypothetical protein CDN99_24045 [Roseateles aquatilis]OWQ90325.1 hypothetical protein CDN99_13230 [Roseateles aquatilis]